MRSNYPSVRVAAGLTLAPALTGLCAGLMVYIYAVTNGGSSGERPPALMGLMTPLLFMAVAMIFYGVPSAMLGICSALMRPYKSKISCFLVSVSGGAAAIIWTGTVRLLSREQLIKLDLSTSSMFPYIPGMNDLVIFASGALSAFVLAALVLPKRPPSMGAVA